MDTDEDGQPLSLKQQARRAKELAEKRARDAAKAQREATVKQIKTDKMVREKDENWTTTNGVTKGGKDVGTFRDKVSGSRRRGGCAFPGSAHARSRPRPRSRRAVWRGPGRMMLRADAVARAGETGDGYTRAKTCEMT